MKINELNLQQNTRQVTVNDFKRPATLGNTPKEVNRALDNAFKPIKSLLQHSLSGLLSAGYNAFVGYGVLLQLCQNPLIRAAVESKASDMTNRWGKFTIEGANNSEKLAERCETLNKQMNKYGIQKLFRKGACGAGYFGGTYLFIDILGDEQEDWINPLILSKETIPIGTLRGFKIIDPYLVTPTHYNSINPMADNYYQPQVFYVQGIPVHTSRLLYFGEGEPLPTMLRPAYNFTNISLAQKMLDAVAHYTSCRENAQALLERYALTVFKTNMSDVLSNGADTQIQNRVKYFIQNRNNFGVATIDKEQEELITQTTSLGGLTDIMQRAMEYVAAMADEPVTRMWGLSPMGFSTGDSDIRNHYDKIEAKQEMMFRKNIEIVNQLLQYNYFGDYDNEIVFTFNPLTEENESVKIANNIQKAQYDATLLQNGIIQQEDVRKRLLDDPDSGYNSLEELEDMPPAMQPFIDEQEEEQVAEDDTIDKNGAHHGEGNGKFVSKNKDEEKRAIVIDKNTNRVYNYLINKGRFLTKEQIKHYHEVLIDAKTSKGITIQEISGHCFESIEDVNREPSAEDILECLQSKLVTPDRNNKDRQHYLGSWFDVVVTDTGIMVTVTFSKTECKRWLKENGKYLFGSTSKNEQHSN